MSTKKTLLIGATTNQERTAFQATHKLKNAGHDVILLGTREGSVAGIPITHGFPQLTDIDTITLYLNPIRQSDYYDYIISLKPNRIIFNPGTENPELVNMAKEQGIEVELACTLVLLSTNQY